MSGSFPTTIGPYLPRRVYTLLSHGSKLGFLYISELIITVHSLLLNLDHVQLWQFLAHLSRVHRLSASLNLHGYSTVLGGLRYLCGNFSDSLKKSCNGSNKVYNDKMSYSVIVIPLAVFHSLPQDNSCIQTHRHAEFKRFTPRISVLFLLNCFTHS